MFKASTAEWAVVVIAVVAAVVLLVLQVPGHRAEMLAGQRIDWPNPRQ